MPEKSPTKTHARGKLELPKTTERPKIDYDKPTAIDKLNAFRDLDKQIYVAGRVRERIAAGKGGPQHEHYVRMVRQNLSVFRDFLEKEKHLENITTVEHANARLRLRIALPEIIDELGDTQKKTIALANLARLQDAFLTAANRPLDAGLRREWENAIQNEFEPAIRAMEARSGRKQIGHIFMTHHADMDFSPAALVGFRHLDKSDAALLRNELDHVEQKIEEASKDKTTSERKLQDQRADLAKTRFSAELAAIADPELGHVRISPIGGMYVRGDARLPLLLKETMEHEIGHAGEPKEQQEPNGPIDNAWSELHADLSSSRQINIFTRHRPRKSAEELVKATKESFLINPRARHMADPHDVAELIIHDTKGTLDRDTLAERIDAGERPTDILAPLSPNAAKLEELDKQLYHDAELPEPQRYAKEKAMLGERKDDAHKNADTLAQIRVANLDFGEDATKKTVAVLGRDAGNVSLDRHDIHAATKLMLDDPKLFEAVMARAARLGHRVDAYSADAYRIEEEQRLETEAKRRVEASRRNPFARLKRTN